MGVPANTKSDFPSLVTILRSISDCLLSLCNDMPLKSTSLCRNVCGYVEWTAVQVPVRVSKGSSCLFLSDWVRRSNVSGRQSLRQVFKAHPSSAQAFKQNNEELCFACKPLVRTSFTWILIGPHFYLQLWGDWRPQHSSSEQCLPLWKIKPYSHTPYVHYKHYPLRPIRLKLTPGPISEITASGSVRFFGD